MSTRGGRDPRKLAREAIAAAVAAVEPRRMVKEAISARSGEGRIEKISTVVAVGKAAPGMAAGAVDALGNRIRSGVVVCPAGTPGIVPVCLELVRAGHPLPDDGSVAAARRAESAIRDAARGQSVLVLLSGGASALMSMPVPGVTLADLRATSDALLRAGASIEELNAVRKHIDAVKGGGLARVAGARIVALVISDVPGDPLDVIASGPLVPDRSTFGDAWRVIHDLGVAADVPASVLGHLEEGMAGRLAETPKRRRELEARVEIEVIGGVRQALAAAARVAADAGYDAEVRGEAITGEAREVGGDLGARLRIAAGQRSAGERPVCLLAGGEATVTVRGGGRGGRNQETALAAALAIEGVPDVLVACCATDGIDGPTDVAGAFADGESVHRAERQGLDPRQLLDDNDSYRFFAALDDHIVTGPTGTNVADLALLIAE